MSRLRIVHILTRLELGGVELSILHAIRHLNRSLFEPHLIAGPGGDLDQEAGMIPDVPMHFCGELSREVRPLADLDAFDQVRTKLRELKPDIVHTHRGKAGVAGRLAAASSGVPVIVHSYSGFGFHKFQPEGAYRLAVALDRECNRRSRHLVFVSRQNLKTAQEMDLIQGCGTSVIRTGVEVEPLLQAKRSDEFRVSYHVPKRAKIVAMISSLRAQKDPLTFVEAASLVIKKSRSTRFILFGEGELAGAVERRAGKAVSRQSLIRAGWTRNVPDVLANIDVLVAPSLWEGLPRIIPEATIAGVPVVASRADGIADVLFEGRNGYLAEPQNAEDFAEKILMALAAGRNVDEELSRQIQHEYDIREMIRHMEALYLDLASFVPPALTRALQK
jgi:glycosyltransferase involved in cell wall biosynthesis